MSEMNTGNLTVEEQEEMRALCELIISTSRKIKNLDEDLELNKAKLDKFMNDKGLYTYQDMEYKVSTVSFDLELVKRPKVEAFCQEAEVEPKKASIDDFTETTEVCYRRVSRAPQEK